MYAHCQPKMVAEIIVIESDASIFVSDWFVSIESKRLELHSIASQVASVISCSELESIFVESAIDMSGRNGDLILASSR